MELREFYRLLRTMGFAISEPGMGEGGIFCRRLELVRYDDTYNHMVLVKPEVGR
jgi:hypothetical protein